MSINTLMIRKINRNIAAYGCELIIKSSTPIVFNVNDILFLFLTQKTLWHDSRTSVNTPDAIIPIITIKYANMLKFR